MKQLEVEELQACLIDAIREVQQGETIEVVIEGNVVAMLVPALADAAEKHEAPARHNALAAEVGKHATESIVVDAEKVREALASLDALRAEMDKYVTEPIDVTQILSEMRGRLE
jgi:antitoxin (DNA-binding transcriptional repressor) of toxin-antitoxin stability system